MRWKPDRYGGLRALLRQPSIRDEVREELEHHIAERVAANRVRGMTEQAAREDALQRFGDLDRITRETIEIDEGLERERKRMEFIDTLRRELAQAKRGLLRAPGFALMAVIALGVGLGAGTAVFALIKAVVLDPLPYPASERLVRLDHEVPAVGAGQAWGLSSASYFHFREQSRTLEDVGVYWVNSANLRARGDAVRGTGVWVSANLPGLLGGKPALGRLFTASDDHSQAPRVAVLTYEYWQREYGGGRDVLGQTLDVDGGPVEIVGVLDKGFALPAREADVFLARRLDSVGPHYNWHHLSGIGRIRTGVSLANVRAELTHLTMELPERYPSVYTAGFMEDTKFTTRVQDLRDSIVGDVSRVLWILMGSVVVVLLIACVNVANLFLVRADSRQTEYAVRSALGSSRLHGFMQSLSESLLIAAMAGALGIAIAYAGLRVLVATAPSSVPRLDEVGLSVDIMLFAVALAFGAGLVFATFPVLRRRVDYAPLRAGRGLTASRVQLRVRSVLVTAQIALAVILLASAGLLLRSFQAMRSVDLGFATERVLTMTVALPMTAYDTHEKAAAFWRQLLDGIEALPGVTNVGATNRIPLLSHGCAVADVTPSTKAPDAVGCVPNMIVTPGFFDAAGIPVSGRQPTWADIDQGTGAVVVSRALADRLWPGEDPIGRGIRVPNEGTRYYMIVGVAGDIRADGVRNSPTQLIYYPVREIEGAPLWSPATGMTLVIGVSHRNSEQLAPAVRNLISSIDRSVAVGTIAPFDRIVAQSMIQTTFTTVLLGIAGTMALLLSVVGLYGVVAYAVGRRRSEIGIRLALGARAGEIGRMIVLESMRIGVIGVIAGLLGAILVTRLLRSLLFGVEPADPITLTAVAFALLTITAAAAFIPARRAASVQPTETLRAQT